MKKFVAIALSLVLILAMASVAVAETRTFLMVAVTDLEGNEMTADEMPVLVFGLDNETMTCAFGIQGETKEGTAELATTEDGVTVIYVTIEGETIMMEYIDEDDCFCYVDEANGLVYYLARVEVEAE